MIKNLNVKKITMSVLLGTTLCVSGCSSKTDELPRIKEVPVEKNETTLTTNSQTNNVTEKEAYQIVSGNEKISSEEEVVPYIEGVKNKLEQYINKENAEKALVVTENVLKHCAKMMLNIEPIYDNYYLKDLPADIQEQFVKVYTSIDTAVVRYYPNYKEEISETASELWMKSKNTASKLSDKARQKLEEKLTEEELEKLDQAVEKGKTTYDEAKDYLKEKGHDFTDWFKEKKEKVKEKVRNW